MSEAAARTARAPVLLPGTCAGVEIPAGRVARVEVSDDGAVVVTSPSGTTTVAGPGEVTRAVVLTGTQVPRWADRSDNGVSSELVDGPAQLLALLSGDRPVATVLLNEFSPRAATGAVTTEDAGARLRSQAGATAVGRALRVPVEGATDAEVAAVAGPAGRAAAVTLVDPASRRPRSAPLVAVLAGVVTFVSWPLGFGVLTAAVSAVGAVLALPLVWRVFRGRRLFLRVADTVPELAGAHVFAADRPTTRGLQQARLLVHPERVVLHVRGTERTAPGPALGGVLTCEVADDLVSFLDEGGQPLLSVGRACFFTTDAEVDRLAGACDEVGITVARLPHDDAAGRADGDDRASLARDRSLRSGLVPLPWQTGCVTGLTPWLTWVVSMMLLATGFGLFVAQAQLWALPLFVIYAAGFVAATYSSLALTWWARRQRKKV